MSVKRITLGAIRRLARLTRSGGKAPRLISRPSETLSEDAYRLKSALRVLEAHEEEDDLTLN